MADQPKKLTGYLAKEGYEDLLRDSLRDIVEVRGRLFLAAGDVQEKIYWAQNIWRDVSEIPFASVSEAARLLRERGRYWFGYQFHHFRRAELIQSQLPKILRTHIDFPFTGNKEKPLALGSWTLWEREKLLAARECTSDFPNGEFHFREDKVNPPNRAYLKLWEALTRIATLPLPGARCLDLGASPGGWTSVLATLGCRVVAVDRSPLDPRLMSHPLVEFRQGNAFAAVPDEFPEGLDWLFCDVACYPEKLREFLVPWLASKKCENFVCTVKLQKHNHGELAEFEALAGGQLVWLYHNKHELTWIRIGEKRI